MGLIHKLRFVAFMLYLTPFFMILAVLETLLFPIIYFVDPNRSFFHKLNAKCVYLAIWPFINIRVYGVEENFPHGRGCVLASNHQSLLDALIFSVVGKIDFRVTYKQELKWYPGVGLSFILSGHIPLKRGDKESGRRAIEMCKEYIRRGVSTLFFPEATRKIDPTALLGDFKAGAFTTAIDEQCPVVPITISGARNILAPYGFPELHAGDVVMTVHPPIETTGMKRPANKDDPDNDVDKLSARTKQVIASALRDCDNFANYRARKKQQQSTGEDEDPKQSPPVQNGEATLRQRKNGSQNGR
eukprot:gb/GECG01006837.1/.p1 GENE.gb/GECG01006837.1/~~gb/GECG01006837.1/.p1  ORF type:complete len:301 (+),score=27.35 gb/GECG01006837.1/:1-903(+)